MPRPATHELNPNNTTSERGPPSTLPKPLRVTEPSGGTSGKPDIVFVGLISEPIVYRVMPKQLVGQQQQQQLGYR